MGEVLPPNWVTVNLKDSVDFRKGKKPAILKDTYFEGSVPYLDIKGLEKGIVNFYADSSSAKYFKENDVVIVWDGSRSGLILKPREGAIGSTLGALSPIGFNSQFLYYFLLSHYEKINSKARGVGIPHVDPIYLWNLLLPLPPLAEQERIVAKLDALFMQYEAMKKALERIPQLLKDFRQQVLTQAVTGKLTEEWREGKGLEQWTHGKIEDFLTPKGIFDGPFGSNLKTEDYSDLGDVQVVRLENIDTLRFLNDKQVYVTAEKYKTLLRHEVYGGDIIFSSFIADRIRACILPENGRKMIAKADCFCLRADKNLIINKFLVYFLVSPLMFKQLQKEVRGATRPRINTTILKKSPVNIPPLSEQQEIVSCIESLFAKADRIEERYSTLKAKIEVIPQAILHKAFKGDLVQQLPSDGDAKNLLQQIKKLKIK